MLLRWVKGSGALEMDAVAAHLACTTSCIGSRSSCFNDSGMRGKKPPSLSIIGDKGVEDVCAPSNISSRPTHLYLCMIAE
jgi:hypothetical protein